MIAALDIALDGHKETGNGELRFCCPFCHKNGKSHDTKHHLYLNPVKEKWICFRCSSRGTLRWLCISLGIYYENNHDRKVSYIEERGLEYSVVKALFGNENLTLDTPATVYPTSMYPILGSGIPHKYLNDRGVSDETILEYDLSYGDYVGSRIFLPTYDIHGEKLVGWDARLISGTSAKYLSSSEKSIFNLHRAKNCGIMTIVEGAFDAIKLGPCAVALRGKSLSKDSFRMLSRLQGIKEFVVCLDPDAKKEAIDLCEQLTFTGKTVTMMDLLSKDPGSATEIELLQSFMNRKTIGITEHVEKIFS